MCGRGGRGAGGGSTSPTKLAKKIREYILVWHIISGEIWLHCFGGDAVSYIPYINFERLTAEDTTNFRLGLIFGHWYIVKLD